MKNEDNENFQFKPFHLSLRESNLYPLTSIDIQVLQINFGKLCNQACLHCHVEAGPWRTEVITWEILESCLHILNNTDIPTVDITGGAPEMNPNFRRFVQECGKIDKHVMVRSNLTILTEPGYEDLPALYKKNRVEVISSLPYYTEKYVDRQRGKNVFQKSILALKNLNALGYGCENGALTLNIVYNPSGAFLTPPQSCIERDFKRQLSNRYGIRFNQLFTITNMPIGRFRDFLDRTGNYESYMHHLISAYNPNAASGVMCRYTLSVGWDGRLYDCDFNQMLGLNCNEGAPDHIRDFDLRKLKSRHIVVGLHCYGCTAGSGSSCGGAVVSE